MDIKDILEEIAKPARSNKNGFYEKDKLEAIEELLEREGSPFYLIRKSDYAYIFGQGDVEEGVPAMLITSHADIVDSMTNVFSEYDEDKKYFKGTYDNLGTNGAAVSLMLNREMPRNVYFSFTAEEESGRNTGAAATYQYILNKSKENPTCVALDVTYEGYDENMLFTLEGAHGQTETSRQELIMDAFATEGESQSFEVVRLKKKHDNSFLPENYRVKDTCDPDESYYYAKEGCNSCSICLPGDGSMHSNSGFYVKEAVMRGYEASLASFIYSRTRTFPDLVDEIKAEKDAYVTQAKETPKRNPYSYYGNSGVYYGHSSVPAFRNNPNYNDFYNKSYEDMTDEEREVYDYDSSFFYYDDEAVPCPSSNWRDEEPLNIAELDDETKAALFDEIFECIWDVIEAYDEGSFELFYNDMCDLYGVVDNEENELRAFLESEFNSYYGLDMDEDEEMDDR